MIYHQFVTKSVMVSNTYWQHGAYIGFIIYKQMCT